MLLCAVAIVVLCAGAGSFAGADQSDTVRRWSIVVNGTAKGGAGGGTPSRRLLGHPENLFDSEVEITSLLPVVSPTTGQSEHTICVHIERNVGGPQLQVRLQDASETTTIVHGGGAACGTTLHNECAYTLNVRIAPQCTVPYEGAMWCESCMTVTVPSGPQATVVTEMRVVFELPLVFTVFDEATVDFLHPPIRFNGVLEVTLTSQTDAKGGRDLAPFTQPSDQLSVWMTGPCALTLSGVTSTAQLQTLASAAPGDKVCIVAEASGDVVANIDLMDVVGCLREDQPTASVKQAIPSHVAKESLCLGAWGTTTVFGIFSTGTNELVPSPSGVRRFDEYALDHECGGGPSPTTRVCRHPDAPATGDGVTSCGAGETCMHGGKVTRAVREIFVPDALRPTYCWQSLADVGLRAAAVQCTAACVTPCAPFPTLVALEATLPVVQNIDSNLHMQYEIRVSWTPFDPLAPAGIRRRSRALLEDQSGGREEGRVSTHTIDIKQRRAGGVVVFVEGIGSFGVVLCAGVFISATVLYATRPKASLTTV